MQVTGSVTTIDRIKVDITAEEMINALESQWTRDIGMFKGDWINTNGNWETDVYIPGRPTGVVRNATEEEKAIAQAFKTLRAIKFSK